MAFVTVPTVASSGFVYRSKHGQSEDTLVSTSDSFKSL
jgi:hypothetical protein